MTMKLRPQAKSPGRKKQLLSDVCDWQNAICRIFVPKYMRELMKTSSMRRKLTEI
jgi:hypothetical protein